MSARRRCDLCPQWHTQAKPVRDIQITAKVEPCDGNDLELETIEWERMDLCAACTAKWADLVKTFIARLKAARGAREQEEAKEVGDL